MSRRRVLWISNYGYHNSYCTVTKTLLRAFLKKYPNEVDLYLFCIGQTQHYDFAERVSKEINLPVEKIYFTVVNTFDFSNEEDADYMKYLVLGVYHLERICEIVRPDLIISLNDDSPLIVQQKMAAKLGIKIIPYLTFDKNVLSDECRIAGYDFPAAITPAKHSQIEFAKHFKCPVHMLPHIVDTKTFYPLADKRALKEKWVQNGDAFVILAVNRNNIRKRWDLLINAFNLFSKDKENVRLLIKTDKFSDNEEKFSTIHAPQYQFAHDNPKIIFIQREINDIELNEVYNCADVGLSTTSGEGFGLTACEMSLCDIPQVLPNNTTGPWLFGEDYGGLIRCKEFPGSVARSFMSVQQIEKDVICILKVYPHWEDKEPEIGKNEGPLKITRGIKTVLLSEDPEVNKFYRDRGLTVVETIEEVIHFINEAVKEFHIRVAYPRIQVLLNTNLDFVAKLDFEKLFAKRWENRKVYQVNPVHLGCYTSKYGGTGLVSIQHTVEILDRLYNNPELRREYGMHCHRVVNEKFNSDVIVDCMLELLTKTLPITKYTPKEVDDDNTPSINEDLD